MTSQKKINRRPREKLNFAPHLNNLFRISLTLHLLLDFILWSVLSKKIGIFDW